MSMPYDSVAHAGGQTLNYYIKAIAKKDDIDVKLVCFANEKMIEKSDTEKYGISTDIIVRKNDYKNIVGNIFSINSKFNPLHRNCNIMTSYAEHLLINKLNALRQDNYYPDVIICEWTQIVLLIDKIKQVFPNSQYVASEHDVTYLNKYRQYTNEKNVICKTYKRIQYLNTKKRELTAISKYDLVFTHNSKDDLLLKKDGIPNDKLDVLTPYFHKSVLSYKRSNNDILFYGSMAREENISAAVWFIENVMPGIKDLPVRFVIIGGGVNDRIRKYSSERVIVTGFVESIDKYFSEAMCFVCPLIYGAGIKVKVLEALYTGIPVLTNEIGIEGIDAQKDLDYLYCSDPLEYEHNIRMIYDKSINNISGCDFINEEFSYDKSFDNYYKRICGVLGGNTENDNN